MRNSRYGRSRARVPGWLSFLVRHGTLLAALGLVIGVAAIGGTSGCGSGVATVSAEEVDRTPLLRFAGRPLEISDLGCAAAIVIEPETNTILYEKNAHEPRPPASIVKMMVELVVMHEVESGRISLADSVTASAWASRIGGSQVFLAEGEVFTLGELMQTIAISSANDACVAVAEQLAGSTDGFVAMMNHEAEALKLENTRYENVHGLDDDPATANHTTAFDISQLGRALLRFPEVLTWSSTTRSLFRNGTFVLENTNKLLGDFPGLDGLKTGYTHQAGFCLCATAKRDELRFLSVVLGCESNRERFRTSKEVLGRAFGSYVRYSVCSEGDDLGRLPIVGGKIDSVSVQSPRDFALIVSRPDDRYLQTKLVPLADLMAPVGEGQIVGNLQILKGDEVLADMPVVAAEAVAGGGIASWFRKQIDR